MFDFSVTFFITIINIFILSIILRKLLFKPVTKFMADRARRVQDSLDQSEMTKTHANDLLAQYTAKLKTAETDAEAIIRSARESAEAEAKKIIAESQTAAEQTLANARKELELEHQASLAAFRKEAATLVVKATERLVGREIKSEDNLRYAEMLLNEAGKD
ncbi:MAG: ATP synthase F0 subunit B [Treponema sp.]|jgi:F-type H+-transporting ATPase subunit b|nr:ATP synthase F0 subunit B [Treponema sp.]